MVNSFLKPEFWIIKKVDKVETAEDMEQEDKLTPRGWTVFTIHIVAAVLLLMGGMKVLQGIEISEYLAVALLLLYCVLVVGGTMYIFRNYSESVAEKGQTTQGSPAKGGQSN
jgi:choline-glycine betaine transporter